MAPEELSRNDIRNEPSFRFEAVTLPVFLQEQCFRHLPTSSAFLPCQYFIKDVILAYASVHKAALHDMQRSDIRQARVSVEYRIGLTEFRFGRPFTITLNSPSVCVKSPPKNQEMLLLFRSTVLIYIGRYFYRVIPKLSDEPRLLRRDGHFDHPNVFGRSGVCGTY
jgi:hypothetical protein